METTVQKQPNLKGRYQIITPIQAGGFGQTFLAEDLQIPGKRKCVVKQLHPAVFRDDGQKQAQIQQIAIDLFRQEAQILSNLKNTQIPSLYDYFEDQGNLYLVQEWIDGISLGNLVERSGPLTVVKVKQILTELLEILDYLHQAKVLHRDIKPDNIILRQPDQKPVLIDFGSVKQSLHTILHQTSIPCSVMTLSPGFSPPEQVAGRPLNCSSDLYSLGMTAIYLLTGILPQKMETDQQGKLQWTQHLTWVEQSFVTVIDRAIQYHPSDRYATARQMLQELGKSDAFNQCLVGQRSISYPMPTRTSPVRSLHSRPNLSGNPSGNLSAQSMARATTGKAKLSAYKRLFEHWFLTLASILP
jgi:serine/threonine-protein kinase